MHLKKISFRPLAQFYTEKNFRSIQQELRRKKTKNDFAQKRLFKDIEPSKCHTSLIAFKCCPIKNVEKRTKPQCFS